MNWVQKANGASLPALAYLLIRYALSNEARSFSPSLVGDESNFIPSSTLPMPSLSLGLGLRCQIALIPAPGAIARYETPDPTELIPSAYITKGWFHQIVPFGGNQLNYSYLLILQGVMINVSKTVNTKSFSKTQFMVHRTE